MAILGLVAAFVWVALGPSTTRQGIDLQRTTRTVPRYVKALEFLQRHRQYERLARDITREAPSDPARALVLFTWTQENVRKAPRQWAVVDDHILSVIARGYGAPYQIADVFSTLLNYAGVPSFWQWMAPRDGTYAPLVFGFIDGRWAVFDVVNDRIFRDASGRFRDARDVVPGVGLPPPRPLRAELQMPWPRLLYEARLALGH